MARACCGEGAAAGQVTFREGTWEVHMPYYVICILSVGLVGSNPGPASMDISIRKMYLYAKRHVIKMEKKKLN